MSMLDLKLKRLDKEMTLKEYITKYPDDVKEALQKKWDYESRKSEFKEYKAREMDAIEQAKKDISMLVLRNLALEVNMPLKTREDFENDLRFEDADKANEAYEEYSKVFKERAEPLIRQKKNAQEDNAEMIEDFMAEFKDTDAKELFQEMKPYLSASVGLGYTPFPKDTLKIFYLGKNFDKLVEQKIKDAREDERKKTYKELSSKQIPKASLNNLPSNAKKEEKRNSDLPEAIRNFEDAWNL